MEGIVEPELMDDPLQARAYAEADFDRSDQAFTERFLAFFASPQPCPGPGCWVSMGRPAWWPSPQNITGAGAVQSPESILQRAPDSGGFTASVPIDNALQSEGVAAVI